LIVPLLYFAVFAAQPQSTMQTGTGLFMACQALIKSDSQANRGTDDVQVGVCLGYLDGYTAGLAEGSKVVCASQATFGTMARVYVAYMEAHPKLLDAPKNIGLFLALQDAYPCPK